MRAARWFVLLVAVTVLGLVIAPALLTAPVFADDAGQTAIDEGAGTADQPGAVPVTSKPPDPVPIGCTVSRNCAYPPPATISCSTEFGTCSQGSDGFGWVECDGHRTYCSGPSCSGTGAYCKSNSDCSSPNPCTCGQGFCSNYSCFCPSQPDP